MQNMNGGVYAGITNSSSSKSAMGLDSKEHPSVPQEVTSPRGWLAVSRRLQPSRLSYLRLHCWRPKPFRPRPLERQVDRRHLDIARELEGGDLAVVVDFDRFVGRLPLD